MPPDIPVDACYVLIDTVSDLWDSYDHRVARGFSQTSGYPYDDWRTVLISCALLSHAWYRRTKYHLQRHVLLASFGQIRMLSARLRSDVNSRDMVQRVTLASHLISLALSCAKLRHALHLTRVDTRCIAVLVCRDYR